MVVERKNQQSIDDWPTAGKLHEPIGSNQHLK